MSTMSQENFKLEKDLQTLIEDNLKPVFNCRFVASEFSTGALHAGRIDTLALSEDNNPVIIEYKKVESSELINQSLFYLHWIKDHKGDFEIKAQKKLGKDIEIDWGSVRVICIAPNYKKYDLHAVQVMGANIELWKYRLFDNHSLYLEEVFQSTSNHKKQNTGMSNSEPKTNSVEKNEHTLEDHIESKSKSIQELANIIRDYISGLDPSIEEVPKKYYIAYKTTQNIACLEIQTKQIKLYLKLFPSDIPQGTKNYRDVSQIGHFGTGQVEFSMKNSGDFEDIKRFVSDSYQRVGG